MEEASGGRRREKHGHAPLSRWLVAERGRLKARGQHVPDTRRDVECSGVGMEVGTSVKLIVPSVCMPLSFVTCQLPAASCQAQGLRGPRARGSQKKSERRPGENLVSCFPPRGPFG